MPALARPRRRARRLGATARELLLLVGVSAAVFLALLVVGRASAAFGPPSISLSVAPADGGRLEVSGSATAIPQGLAINGVPVPRDASGGFQTVVDAEPNGMRVSFAGPADESIVVHVPQDLVADEASTAQALDVLAGAGTTVVVPPGGFAVLDGTMPAVTVRAADPGRLASLTVNGREILALVRRDGSATVVPPRNSEETIVVTATESRGVSQTSTFATRRLSSTIKTLAGISVSAEGAMGVKLVALRLDRRRLRTERFVRLALRVEDRRGYLVRGARVRLQGLPRRSLAGAAVRWEVTDLLGRAELGLTLRHGAFRTAASRRVAFVVRVTTPRATAIRRVPLVLPALPAV